MAIMDRARILRIIETLTLAEREARAKAATFPLADIRTAYATGRADGVKAAADLMRMIIDTLPID